VLTAAFMFFFYEKIYQALRKTFLRPSAIANAK
jgi:hypothetical protein